MDNFYSRKFKLDADRFEIFENDRKTDLNTVEKYGLEAILDDFILEYESEVYGENEARSIKNYIRWNNDGVDILDGYTDTYVFDHYAIGDVWMTNNGCIMLSAVDLDEYVGDENDPDYIDEFNECEVFEKPSKYDIWSECEAVLFRLN